jgi:hypothetical protein
MGFSVRSYHLVHRNRAVRQCKGSNSCADPVVSVEALTQPFVCTNRDCTNSVDVFFFAASACLASIADEAPYCCRGEAWEMDRRCAAPFCNRTCDLVTGRRAVIKAEILLLTSVHEDVMLEGFIGDRREMAKCWIGKLEGIWNGALNWRSSFARTLDRDLIPESLPLRWGIMGEFNFPHHK